MNELEVKIVRLEVTVENLTKEIHGVRNLLMAGQTPSHVALEEKVANLDRALGKLDNGIENLTKRLEENSKVPWGQYIAAGSLLVTIGLAMLGYFQNHNESKFTRIEKEMAGVVPRIEHQERWKAEDRDHEDLKRRIEILEGKRAK